MQSEDKVQIVFGNFIVVPTHIRQIGTKCIVYTYLYKI